MFDKAMQMFSPFGGGEAEKEESPPADDEAEDQISALERKLNALQAEIAAMTRK